MLIQKKRTDLTITDDQEYVEVDFNSKDITAIIEGIASNWVNNDSLSEEEHGVEFIHCKRCFKEWVAKKQGKISLRDWSDLSVSFTPIGIQIWCNRHNKNVMHLHFCELKLPVKQKAVCVNLLDHTELTLSSDDGGDSVGGELWIKVIGAGKDAEIAYLNGSFNKREINDLERIINQLVQDGWLDALQVSYQPELVQVIATRNFDRPEDSIEGWTLQLTGRHEANTNHVDGEWV
ncbi:MAG TPA: hypothetical protein VLL52_06035 [Anaerolineae bacterium]|nr:hypothetical protein [Anaerolineae bacterium]